MAVVFPVVSNRLKVFRVTPLEELSGEFDKILNYAIRPDLAAFLAGALPGDPQSHLNHKLTEAWKKDPNKPGQMKAWKQLDLPGLLEVIDDRYQFLKTGDKSHEAKKCIERMRDMRNEGAHRTGDVDLHGPLSTLVCWTASPISSGRLP